MSEFTKTIEKDKLWHDDGIDYDWLIDRLEGEKNNINQRAATDFVLSSKGELEAYESLHHIRSIVKACDDVALPESGKYYSQLNEKIMANIFKSEPKEKRSMLQKITTTLVQKNSLMIINFLYLVQIFGFAQVEEPVPA